MKRLNKKLVTIMLAGACVASLGAASVGLKAVAEDTATTLTTYSYSDIFAANNKASVGIDADANALSFTLDDNSDTDTAKQYVYYKNDLAYRWFSAKGQEEHLHLTFAFKDFNFNTVTFEFEVASSVANEEDKAYNAIEFKVTDGKLSAAVIKEDTKEEDKAFTTLNVNAGDDIVVGFQRSANDFDALEVILNGDTSIGEFTHVGANFAEYTTSQYPLKVKADTETDKKTVVLMKEINGQRFYGENIQDSKIVDDTAPVFILNQELYGLQFGTQYSLTNAFEVIDVAPSTYSVSAKGKFYQYDPTAEELSYTDLSSTVYYQATNFEKEDGTVTSVYQEEGREYISITYTLTESKGSNSATIDLSWYVDASALAVPVTDGATKTSVDYIIIDSNEEGAYYNYLANDDENKETIVTDQDALDKQVEYYQERLVEAAKGVRVGENITIPHLDWLIGDNGGYRNLLFTISYKTASSSAKTASSQSWSSLKLSISEEEVYEFKVFATDKANNPMQYYNNDGEFVDVTSSNIWNIDAIPSFSFEIADSKIEIKDSTSASDRKAEKNIDETYTLSGLKVLGAANSVSDFALYRLNVEGLGISESDLISITYASIRDKAETSIANGEVGKNEKFKNYFELYVDIYAELLAEKVGDVTKEEVKNAFYRIEEYNSAITEDDDEWELYNKYNWSSSSKSFETVEQGTYMIIGDYYEEQIRSQRAVGYKVILVEAKGDSVKGDSLVMTWIKNNKVSVILFGVAGLMLIAIIVLLFVKPSNETLEDVDVKAAKAKEKKNKKKNK